jgi:hypothetical protein
MFVIEASPSYLFPVSVPVRLEDGGQAVRNFKARFDRISDDELDALIAGGLNSDRPLVDRVLVGWDGVYESDTTPCEFNTAALARMRANYFGFDFAVAAAFLKSRKFESPEAAAEKN